MEKKLTLHRNSATADDYARINQKRTLNCDEAALYLGVCSKTIRRHTQSGTIPSFKLGRFSLYSRIALDEMIAKKGGAR